MNTQMKRNQKNMKIKLLFTRHPSELGESYWGHLKVASGLSLKLAASASATILHALFPFFDPPMGLDVCSMIEYLEKKRPEVRKNCDDDAD